MNLAAFEQLLRNKFGKFRKTKGRNGIEYKVCCKFCISRGKAADTKFKMYINPEREAYNCYRCDAQGSTREMLGALDKAARVAPVVPEIVQLPSNVDMPGMLVNLTDLDNNHPAIEYLTKTRKIPFDPVEVQNLFGARYCSVGKMYAGMYDTTNTLVFPVFYNGKIVGWQSRMLAEPSELTDEYLAMNRYRKDEDGEWIRPPKYFTSPGFPKGKVMFNWDIAVQTDYIVIVEGVFDAMAVGPWGVATLGKGVTDEQIAKISTWATYPGKQQKHVIILLDDDAQDDAMAIFEKLFRTTKVTNVMLKGYHDAGDTPRAEIWRQINEAIQQGQHYGR